MPAVEIRRLEDPSQHTATVPHAALAGWLNDREILILEEQVLVAFDVDAGTRRDSRIKAPHICYVFLR